MSWQMAVQRVYYTICETGENPDDVGRTGIDASALYDLDAPFDAESVAKVAAMFDFRHRDGWERRWPQRIYLFQDETGTCCFTGTVDVETVPEFSINPEKT